MEEPRGSTGKHLVLNSLMRRFKLRQSGSSRTEISARLLITHDKTPETGRRAKTSMKNGTRGGGFHRDRDELMRVKSLRGFITLGVCFTTAAAGSAAFNFFIFAPAPTTGDPPSPLGILVLVRLVPPVTPHAAHVPNRGQPRGHRVPGTSQHRPPEVVELVHHPPLPIELASFSGIEDREWWCFRPSSSPSAPWSRGSARGMAPSTSIISPVPMPVRSSMPRPRRSSPSPARLEYRRAQQEHHQPHAQERG